MATSSSVGITTVLSTLLLLTGLLSGAVGQCSFPSFLTSPPHKQRGPAHWEGRTRKLDGYISTTEVLFSESRYDTVNYTLDPESGATQQVLYNRTCLTEEGEDVYQVLHTQKNRENRYSCVKFVQRGDHVVQVFEGPLSDDENAASVCDEDNMTGVSWTLNAPSKSKWVHCPSLGGLDLKKWILHNSNGTEDICHGDRYWRPSRLESECMRGEGMEFIFPDSRCNPFDREHYRVRFQCWAAWEEKDYIFASIHMVPAGQETRTDTWNDRKMLKLPRSLQGQAFLFEGDSTSQENEEGSEPEQYWEFYVKPSDPADCFDESEECEKFAAEGLCKNAPPYAYAQFCKRSCGQCAGVTEEEERSCTFPSNIQSTWNLFNDDEKEEVTITEDTLQFSLQGNFKCHEKNWDNKQFKLQTKFTNGCRPRYTCVELTQINTNLLQYRMGHSKWYDSRLYRLCEKFTNDIEPLKDKYRSLRPKNLIAQTLTPVPCGFDKTFHFNMGFVGNRSCNGELSDCEQSTILKRTWDMCDEPETEESSGMSGGGMSGSQISTDFICIARYDDPNSNPIVLTRHATQEHSYDCWFKETEYSPDRETLKKISSAQCNGDGTKSQTMVLDVTGNEEFGHPQYGIPCDGYEAVDEALKPVPARLQDMENN